MARQKGRPRPHHRLTLEPNVAPAKILYDRQMLGRAATRVLSRRSVAQKRRTGSSALIELVRSSSQGDDDYGYGDPFSVSLVVGSVDRSLRTGEAAEIQRDYVVGRGGLGGESTRGTRATRPFEKNLNR